ncbi:MAG: hypothetical protein RLZZ450_3293 [Pseudomonadota bacterium]|jgi:hypothetical protein
MSKQHWAGLALASVSLFSTARVEAHFRLEQPPSWLHEDEVGGPQKGSPCGPGNRMLILGDDVQPVPTSGAVTSFSPGQTVTLELEETVYHPGYFRVSLARTTAARATTMDFPNPPLTDPVDCHFDAKAVATGAHGNVLADGLFMIEGQEGTNRSLKPSVTLPDEPCADCTLQIVQVMEGHPGSSCFYYHCADIKIVAQNPVSADAGTTADAGRTVDAGNTSDAGRSRDAGNAPDASRALGDSAAGDAPRGPTTGTGGDPADTGGCSLLPARRPLTTDFSWIWLVATVSLVACRARYVGMLRRSGRCSSQCKVCTSVNDTKR